MAVIVCSGFATHPSNCTRLRCSKNHQKQPQDLQREAEVHRPLPDCHQLPSFEGLRHIMFKTPPPPTTPPRPFSRLVCCASPWHPTESLLSTSTLAQSAPLAIPTIGSSIGARHWASRSGSSWGSIGISWCKPQPPCTAPPRRRALQKGPRAVFDEAHRKPTPVVAMKVRAALCKLSVFTGGKASFDLFTPLFRARPPLAVPQCHIADASPDPSSSPHSSSASTCKPPSPQDRLHDLAQEPCSSILCLSCLLRSLWSRLCHSSMFSFHLYFTILSHHLDHAPQTRQPFLLLTILVPQVGHTCPSSQCKQILRERAQCRPTIRSPLHRLLAKLDHLNFPTQRPTSTSEGIASTLLNLIFAQNLLLRLHT